MAADSKSKIEHKGLHKPHTSSGSSAGAVFIVPAPDDKYIDAQAALSKQLSDAVQKDNADLKQCSTQLAQLKIALTKFQLLPPFSSEPNKVKRQLTVARETLEAGAFLAIKSKDIVAFERHVTQLKTYYTDYASLLTPSPHQYPITGLHLIALLAHNRISEFHTELELIPLALQANPNIRYPVNLEQRLMEGAYNKILVARSAVPHPLMAFFVDELARTVRDKLAECAEKAYESFPVADALTTLSFASKPELLEYAKKRGWDVTPKDLILFPAHHGAAAQVVAKQKALEIPSLLLIKQTLGYATELERIV